MLPGGLGGGMGVGAEIEPGKAAPEPPVPLATCLVKPGGTQLFQKKFCNNNPFPSQGSQKGQKIYFWKTNDSAGNNFVLNEIA